jgi:ethanolamine ammonia-lyase large subunit
MHAIVLEFILKATEDVSKNLSHIKGILYGVGDQAIGLNVIQNDRTAVNG